ncbi:hypothetical protein [Bacillus sp. FSL R5-0585]|uniref:hypothetical protein n=1 Tax=Bacillus sp. FSL R5-0585 TaxID=2921650 RepID=UPI0030FB62C5
MSPKLCSSLLPQTIYPTRLTTTTNNSNNFIVIASSDVVAASFHLPSTTIGVALGSDLLISHTTVMNAV